MAADRGTPPQVGQARQPINPISRPQIETVVSRFVAIFGILFGAQAAPVVLSQLSQVRPILGYALVVVVYGGILASLVASLVRRFVRVINAYIAVVYLVALIAWPLVAKNPAAVSADRPWLWLLCTVATSTAAIAFSTWTATVYLFIAPLVYGVVRTLPSGGAKSWASASLDMAYAIILGGAVLILITLLRQAAASVDAAQATALDRYAHAVRQHATEVERVQVDSIVHDSVLTTLLSAARAYTPEAKELATRMARNAMGHLKDAATAAPDDDATVSLNQLAHRIMGETATLSGPFELRTRHIEKGSIPVQSAEAVYSAAVQAMMNSLQHAGVVDEVQRWLDISDGDGGIRIQVGDTGKGFAVDDIPSERLGLRVSIVERVANAGGLVEIDSTLGKGTVITIVWPNPHAPESFSAADVGEQLIR